MKNIVPAAASAPVITAPVITAPVFDAPRAYFPTMLIVAFDHALALPERESQVVSTTHARAAMTVLNEGYYSQFATRDDVACMDRDGVTFHVVQSADELRALGYEKGLFPSEGTFVPAEIYVPTCYLRVDYQGDTVALITIPKLGRGWGYTYPDGHAAGLEVRQALAKLERDQVIRPLHPLHHLKLNQDEQVVSIDLSAHLAELKVNAADLLAIAYRESDYEYDWEMDVHI